MNQWLITGGAGFIGTNLSRHIRSVFPDDRIVCFDNLTTGNLLDAQDAGFDHIIVGDIIDAEALEAAMIGIEFVVHLAAQTGVPSSLSNPLHDLQSNVLGSFNVLESARRTSAQKVILASSAAPIGQTPPPMRESSLPKPVSPYGASKLAMESYANVYRSTLGVDTTCLRFSNVYGPLSYRKGSVVARFFNDILQCGQVTINGDGCQTRDFVFVSDICDAITASAHTVTESAVLQLGTGIETKVRDLAALVFAAAGQPENITFAEPLLGEVPRSYADIGLAREELGYSPSVGLEEGLRLTSAWFSSWSAQAT